VSGPAAKQQIDAEVRPKDTPGSGTHDGGESGGSPRDGDSVSSSGHPGPTHPPGGQVLPGSFYGKFSLDSVRAIRQLEEILHNVVEHLARVDGGSVELTLEVNASSPGFDERIQRIVSENAGQLGAKGQEFE
jgi:hypothetical protein